LPIRHTCSATLTLRAQQMSASELASACATVAGQEAYFHRELATGGVPVAGDNNASLEMAVFDSSDDYGIYAGAIFGIDTNNGGMYLEGDPSAPGNQARFIAELHRVSRRAVCLTTPNRWFPVEVHTSVPLLHWLPAGAYRAILGSTRLKFFADEANLNLLSAGDLRKMCDRLAIVGASVKGVRLLGWTSNLLLFVDKTARSNEAGG